MPQEIEHAYLKNESSNLQRELWKPHQKKKKKIIIMIVRIKNNKKIKKEKVSKILLIEFWMPMGQQLLIYSKD